MKKIRSIKQLKAEKQRMKQCQSALEEKIKTDWKAVKESLRPVNIAKDAIDSVLKAKTERDAGEDSIFKSAFKYGINVLTNKISEKAHEKLERLLKK